MFEKTGIREAIRIVARHSNISRPGTGGLFKSYGLFAGSREWKTFLDVALLTLGTGFVLAGIIFFFAYNWQDLPKGVKIGLIEVLVIACGCYAVFSRSRPFVRNMVLTAAAILTGALFAVYGQIYQTGADAYDFFFGWAAAMLLWAMVAAFPALWLLLLLLLNLTLWFYTQQVASDWATSTVWNALFLLNGIPLVLLEWLLMKNRLPPHSGWMLRTVAIAAALILTAGIVFSIFDSSESGVPGAILALIFFPLGIWSSVANRNLFYLALVPLCIIIIISSLIGNSFNDWGAMLLLNSIFIIGSITALSFQLIRLNREWHGSK